jgi:flagellar biosynthetic protein FlhB
MPVTGLRLDLQWFAQEKTEPATPRKRNEARRKGQVAKSAELPAAFILVAVLLVIVLFGGSLKNGLYGLFTAAFSEYLRMEITSETAMRIFSDLALRGTLMLAPIMLASFLVALAVNYVQVGFLFANDPLIPKLNKLDPIKGFKRIFSLRSLVNLAKSIVKFLIIGYLVYVTLMAEKDTLFALGGLPVEDLFGYAASVTMNLGLKIGAALIVLAILDYFYQRYEYLKGLRMSKQDIKDEHKMTEGDPLIKSRIRDKQRRMALRRMMQEVPKADVVITNPTHYAVALRYEASDMDAPQVIAKGADLVALRIREIAREHDIVIMENKPLARALYDKVEIGGFVPAELFQAVAEVLAYVYRIKRKV